MIERLKNSLYRHIGFDRRVSFRDIPNNGNPEMANDIIQFYSSYDNIGNYLPVLGIQQMLGRKTDVCCAHKTDIDFDYINSTYKCAIIGGAGLLHRSFNPFWHAASQKLNLPIIVWGVGVCLPDDRPEEADRTAVNDVFLKAEMVNVRDALTASLYDVREIDISACPTIVYLDQFREKKSQLNRRMLVSWHKGLLTREENNQVIATVRSFYDDILFTNNIQVPSEGLVDIIEQYYCLSRMVITSRLHGAIISYALGIPYIGIACDEKVRAFVREYGNGIAIEEISKLKDKEIYNRAIEAMKRPIAREGVLDFGRRASQMVEDICTQASSRSVS